MIELLTVLVLVAGPDSEGGFDPSTDFEPGLAKAVGSIDAARKDPRWVERDLRGYALSEKAPWTFSLYYEDGSQLVVPLNRIWFAVSAGPSATLFRRHKVTGRLIPFMVALDARDPAVAALPHAEAVARLAVPRFDPKLTPQVTQALNEAQIVFAAKGTLAALKWQAMNPVLAGPHAASAAVVRRGVATGVAREAAAPATRVVPGGGLAAHEAAGGHLLADHVGLTNAQLAARLADEKIPAASTFSSHAVAEQVVRESLDANQAVIATWLKSASGKLELDHVAGTIVGRVLVRGATSTIETYKLRLVLLKAESPLGWRILTGFPQL